MRIVGWYHSHPHITVWPSHVDVRTQASYQLMDKDFIGLIISCFNDDSNAVGQIQVTSFQSVKIANSNPPRFERKDIPQEVISTRFMSDACIESLGSLPDLLVKEESDAYSLSLGSDTQDMITAIQNASVFSQSLMRIIEFVCAPYLQNLEHQKKDIVASTKRLKRKYSSVIAAAAKQPDVNMSNE